MPYLPEGTMPAQGDAHNEVPARPGYTCSPASNAAIRSILLLTSA